MKILLLAQIDSIFTYELVTNLKKKNTNIEFDIYSSNPSKKISKYDGMYNQIFSPNHTFHNIPILKTVLNVISFFIFILNSKKKYSSIHVLYIDYLSYFNYLFFRLISDKTILTIYGSDFYKLNKLKKKIFSKCIKKADLVTCTNYDIENKINDQFNNINIKTIRFGLTPLKYINDIYKGKIDLNFSELNNKFVIACGYNGYKNNNHLIIIEALNKIKENLPKNYIIVFQITYGSDETYIQEIKSLIKKYSLNALFIEKFLSYEKLASLRLLSNISILTLSTDSFSGTMQEYIYAKNILITGNWLPYDLLKEKNVYFETINDFDGLPEKIKYCISNYKSLKSKTNNNSDIIWELSSWENNIDDWLNIYN